MRKTIGLIFFLLLYVLNVKSQTDSLEHIYKYLKFNNIITLSSTLFGEGGYERNEVVIIFYSESNIVTHGIIRSTYYKENIDTVLTLKLNQIQEVERFINAIKNKKSIRMTNKLVIAGTRIKYRIDSIKADEEIFVFEDISNYSLLQMLIYSPH